MHQDSKKGSIDKFRWVYLDKQREFFDDVAKDLFIRNKEDWYQVKISDIAERGGRWLLDHYYGGSLIKALQAVYPDHNWKLNHAESGYWKHRRNQREFLEWLASELHLQTLEEWYNVTLSQVKEKGGSGFLTNFGNSFSKALVELIPEYDWLAWRFNKTPKSFWDDEKNQHTYLQWLSDKLRINDWNDWYSVSFDQISSLKGSSLLQHHGGLIPFLSKHFPQVEWTSNNPEVAVSKGQAQLIKRTQELFSNVPIQFNYKHPDLLFKTQSRMELDIFLPSLSLALEYQGEQHYKWHYVFGSSQNQQIRDSEKREACEKAGITLVEIPFWLDMNKENISQSIIQQRPGFRFRKKANSFRTYKSVTKRAFTF